MGDLAKINECLARVDGRIRTATRSRTSNEFPALPVQHVHDAGVAALAEALGRLYVAVPGEGQCGRQSLALNCNALGLRHWATTKKVTERLLELYAKHGDLNINHP